MKALVGARAALAELKQAGELIPNQSILINTLPVLEARASSEIENIVTTADRLFRFAQHDESEQADPATKEALRYQSALMQGLRELAKKPVTTGTAVDDLPDVAWDCDRHSESAWHGAEGSDAQVKWSTRHPRERTCSAACWPIGSAFFTTPQISIR